MKEPAARRNLVLAREEAFKPPVFKPNTSRLRNLTNAARRFVDLQAGSIWDDLQVELAPTSGMLLDVGCGAQIYRPLVPKAVTYRGIDTIDAKAKFGYEIPDTYYFSGTDWKIAAASVDTVLCTEVMEHVELPATLLAQISESLRVGGRLVLTVPFAARWHFVPYDYWRYTPSTLNRLLDQAGFADVRVTARGNPLTVACYKVMALPLILLLGTRSGLAGVVSIVFGLALTPMLLVAAVIGNLSMSWDWGQDCLGYTVTARKRVAT
jgi:SAM-dependent methyltransferase